MRTLVLCLAASLFLTACATTTQAPPSPAEGFIPATAPVQAVVMDAPADLVDDPPLTLYPKLADTPLLARPAFAGEVLELLAADQRLVRFFRRGPWARVLDVASGRIGWAEDRLLTGQPPAAPKKPGNGTISETF